ncbi:hypothetical protein JXA32_12535 [Candidatus Sumerlaeota bacterium]|nr:hypothetical protein [Candidatus Sumerlaeota bacterium]
MLSQLMHTVWFVGATISLSALVIYFCIPAFYYAGLFRWFLWGVCIYGCYLVLANAGPWLGLFWTLLMVGVFAYCSTSGWYRRMVLKRTYEEWKRYGADQNIAPEGEEDRSAGEMPQEKLLGRVAESWNPQWTHGELQRLVDGIETLEQLDQRIVQRAWIDRSAQGGDEPKDAS